MDAAKQGVKLSSTPARWDDLALVYSGMKKYEEAVEAEKKAIELSPEPNPRYEKKLKQYQKSLEKIKEQK